MRTLQILFWLCALLLPALGQANTPKILVLGDSLSAAYGIPVQQGWVALLQQRLRAQGYPHEVVNASISGDTTQGGLTRLPAALKLHQPKYVLIELGGNDGLRGLTLKKMRDNLTRIIELSRAAGAEPLLFEMRIPSNYGVEYTEQFVRSFSTVAKAQKVPLQPFFLMTFAEDPKAFQEDGIHPSVAQQPKMLDAAWPQIERLIGPSKASAKAKTP